MSKHTFLMKYKHCGTEWVETWACACNSKCPKCGAEIKPMTVEDIN